ncbi:MAG TPA: hypothetical protein V6D16_14550 [Candidatus Obscuribacterales bacterium]|jgi:hypothetical protein
MKTFAACLILTTSLLSLPNQVKAQTSGIDFSQTNNTVTINTISTSNPNVLRTVTIRCPDNGFLVATANTKFQYSAGPNFAGTIAYSISKNSTAFDPNHQHNLFGNFVNNLTTVPASIQRVDECEAGKTITYRFVATQGTNVFNVSASQPNLVVLFFRNRL